MGWREGMGVETEEEVSAGDLRGVVMRLLGNITGRTVFRVYE